MGVVAGLFFSIAELESLETRSVDSVFADRVRLVGLSDSVARDRAREPGAPWVSTGARLVRLTVASGVSGRRRVVRLLPRSVSGFLRRVRVAGASAGSTWRLDRLGWALASVSCRLTLVFDEMRSRGLSEVDLVELRSLRPLLERR